MGADKNRVEEEEEEVEEYHSGGGFQTPPDRRVLCLRPPLKASYKRRRKFRPSQNPAMDPMSASRCLLAVLAAAVAMAATAGEAKKVAEAEESAEEGRLEFVFVLYRHGDRTPIDMYPTDPYKDPSNWPVGFGQLTPRGKQMQVRWLSNACSIANLELVVCSNLKI